MEGIFPTHVAGSTRISSPVDRLLLALCDPGRRNRTVVGVLVAYVVLWTLCGVLLKASQNVHLDMAELAAWAREPAFGYSKHPPLAAWLVSLWFSIFPVADWSYYLLGITYAALALWIAWVLFDRFLDAEKRVIALALLTLIPFFNLNALKFDHNAVLVPLWAATALCFIRSFESPRNVVWASLAGASAGAAMLGKYWSIFLLAGLALAALLDTRRAAYFRSRSPWVTMAVGGVVLAPHIAWLAAKGFAPLAYMLVSHETNSLTKLARSMGGYLAGADGYVVLPVVLVLLASRPTRAAFAETLVPRSPERRFAATAFWVPLFLPALTAMVLARQMDSLWAAPAWALLPVVLLSSPLISISRAATRAILAVAIMWPPLMIAASPAIAVVVHRSGVNHTEAHGPLLAERIAREWRHMTPAPLRLIGGDPEIVAVTAFYLPYPAAISPIWDQWLDRQVDAQRIAQQGIALLCDAHEAAGTQICQRRPVREQIEKILASSPASQRIEIEAARYFAGISGQSLHYLVFMIPPRL